MEGGGDVDGGGLVLGGVELGVGMAPSATSHARHSVPNELPATGGIGGNALESSCFTSGRAGVLMSNVFWLMP